MVGLMERVGEQEDIVNGAAALGRTPYEILIIASMIEREAGSTRTGAKIARVIYNRLFLEMPLQIDAAVYYGATRRGSTPPAVLRAPPDRQARTTRICERRPAADADRQPRPGVDPGGAQPGAEPVGGRPDLRRSCPTRRRCFYLYYVLANEDGGHAFAVDARAAPGQRRWPPRRPGCCERVGPHGGLAALIGSPVATACRRPSTTPRSTRPGSTGATSRSRWRRGGGGGGRGDAGAGHRRAVGHDAAQARRRRRGRPVGARQRVRCSR